MNGKDRSHNLNEEEALRAAYRAAAAGEREVDVWPRVSASLHAAVPRRFFWQARAPQWAWGAAATVVIAGLGLWHPFSPASHVAAPSAAAPRQSPPGASARLAVDALADVPQVNPAVDDPARSSVEQIWVQLGNPPAAEAHTQ